MKNAILGNYMPMDDELQIIEEVLTKKFVGEVDNAITRERIKFILDKWNMIGANLTMDNININ